MESKKLVIAGHRGQRAFLRRKTRDHRCRVREAALGQTDNAVLDEFFFCTVMTVSLGPPCSVLGGAPACFDSNDVGRDGADAQSSGDPGDYVGPFHGPVQQENIDEFTGRFSIAVGPSRRGPERVMSGRELT